ncbi:helix-turn-helix domain-containing protein [Curtobacterium sp. MCBD17_021]|uniref:helix-turn-helix domain-containing protein n=1 Tax=Curtobacterium sp. MCBD17_021 TaxID=2175665 RepID=UPI000DA85C5F|nr:hypothetical protein DEI83_02215 [Curtobacterium sp. MCBD17_021]
MKRVGDVEETPGINIAAADSECQECRSTPRSTCGLHHFRWGLSSAVSKHRCGARPVRSASCHIRQDSEHLFTALCQFSRQRRRVPDRSEPNLSALRLAVQQARHDAGLTWDELAARSGLQRRSVQYLASGERTGSLSAWWKLARGLGVRFSELMEALDATDSQDEAAVDDR